MNLAVHNICRQQQINKENLQNAFENYLIGRSLK